MELTPEQNEVCDEAIRCLDCLMDSDQPFDDYLETYCRERCPDWPIERRLELVAGVHQLAELSAKDIIEAGRSRPLTAGELDVADAYCDRQDEAAAYVIAVGDLLRLGEGCGFDPRLVHPATYSVQ